MSEVSPSNQNDNGEKDTNSNDVYVPVQEYTGGEEYTLANGKETGRIANEKREEVEKAIQSFFKEDYKTDVKVHNIVGNVDGATVFVESIGEPHFYTYAIIPIDRKQEIIMTDSIWTQEMVVEDAIITGLYGLAYKSEFNKLDKILEEISIQFNLTGKTIEAIKNSGGAGFSTNFYFVQVADNDPFKSIIDKYLQNPNIKPEQWNTIFSNSNIKPEALLISIKMYMSNNDEPNKKAFEKLVSVVEKSDDIPSGAYSIILNNNEVNKTNGISESNNSLEQSYPQDIIKD
ncbi:hypothetical protein JCM21714_4468 [Gracilibacillus boraciitolerans JCM 21714]|uniref:DUF1672 family protein n=1 Tax=Gracilibacillus boraciitolerans JCM 21714 TaxID=1298598 RepID=W4VPZ3_9BACI|nr:DUF1672 family protein [Gracilibacillus boraciitolerans]GAE95251.1 hypothetical protein JCM21714_4468 [Gracilibacillus boraciitolerans JCM 21714]